MKFVTVFVSGGSVLTTIAGIILWAVGSEVAAAIVLTTTVLLWLIVVIVATVGITTWWTRQTMQQGAELVLRAQDINDRWDASKIGSLAGLMREGAKMARFNGARPEDKALPPMVLSGQSDHTWLPELVEFNTPMIDIDTQSEVNS